MKYKKSAFDCISKNPVLSNGNQLLFDYLYAEYLILYM